MATEREQDLMGEFRSPGGFVFGVAGWTWGEQRPTSITFFVGCGGACCTKTDGLPCPHLGAARVCDQHGRPIRGTVRDGKPTYFDRCSHAQVIAALETERVEWQKLACAGWPQLPYEELKALPALPPTPIEELRKIHDHSMRRDALRIRREVDAARDQEVKVALEE